MTLRVSRLDGRVTLTLPNGVAERDALAFAGERAAWIRSHLAQQVASVEVGLGTAVPVLGQPRRVVPGAGRAIVMEADRLAVPGAAAQVPRRVQGWLKALARDELAAAVERHAARLGRGFTRLTLRDTRSRWGSCSAAGGLNFSWRLVMAPREVLDYVAAHEVAHLAEMNHSKAFWAVVSDLYGPHAAPRAWLRTQGHTLHAYRFAGETR